MDEKQPHRHIQEARDAENSLQPIGEGLEDVVDEIAARGTAAAGVEGARQRLLLLLQSQANGEPVSDAEISEAQTAVMEAEERQRKIFPPS